VERGDSENVEQLSWLGLDLSAPAQAETLRLVRHVLAQGADRQEVLDAVNTASLGPLALDLALRGGGEAVPFARAARDVGLEPEAAATLWRALGFPDPLSSSTVLRPSQVRTLGVLAGVGRSELGSETVLRLARVIGGAIAMIAESVVDAFRVRVEMPREAAGEPHSEVVEEYSRNAPVLLSALSEALDDILRGHVVAVARSTWAPDESQAIVTRERTVGFADLVGYTRSARALPAAELAEAISQFESRVGELVNRGGGRVVKLIGDEAMFVIDDPAEACRVSAQLRRAVRGIPQLPEVRIGLVAGPVVGHHGDYYGDVVNLAARLVKVAQPGEVLVSQSVADGLPPDAVEAVQTPVMKGYDEGVAAYRLISCGGLEP
jgi:adenylate cyclase